MTKNNVLFLKININTQVLFFLTEEGDIYTNGLIVRLNHKSTENRLKMTTWGGREVGGGGGNF